jgi:hypothetical protein
MAKHTAPKQALRTTTNTATGTAASTARGAVVVVGGNGGLTPRYREVVAERGLEIRHFETRIPNGARHNFGRVAAIVVMVGMVSHALRDQVKGLAPVGAPIVYLRSASISALREAVAEIVA